MRVEVLIDPIGERHDVAHRLAELASLVVLPREGSLGVRFLREERGIPAVPQLTAEVLGNEVRRATGDVDVLADEVAVDARDEIIGVEVEILDIRVQLRRDVVAQPFGVQANVEIAQRADARAARFGHFLAGDGDEAVDEHVVGDPVGCPGELQHRRPEQRVKVDDVLADEMDLFGVGRREELLEAAWFPVGARLATVEIALQ